MRPGEAETFEQGLKKVIESADASDLHDIRKENHSSMSYSFNKIVR
jgi:hypothetical protein